ncbi:MULTISPECIES: hypothetical protein [unclassified Duganella]|uniref:hypothetical protein n=1 Tax=unclassified Duganella TaxID=2636909 RepID=UPI001113EE6E|nr:MULTISPECIES: hypothetical protein [unclassified Duganella]
MFQAARKNKISSVVKLFFTTFAGMLTAQAAMAAGPGMTLSYRNVIPGVTVSIKEAKTSSGEGLTSPGALAPSPDPMRHGKTLSGSDNRDLPEWVEFSWREWVYGVDNTKAELAAMPMYQRRVYIRQRIPQDVVDEVIAANRVRKPGTLAEKWLQVYLVWYPGETRVYWELNNKASEVLRSGGDQLPVTVW